MILSSNLGRHIAAIAASIVFASISLLSAVGPGANLVA